MKKNLTQQKLRELERKYYRKVRYVLLSIFMNLHEDQLLAANNYVLDLFDVYRDLWKQTEDTADFFSDEKHKINKKKQQLLLFAALTYLLSYVQRKIAISTEKTYSDKVKTAIAESKPIIKRAVISEIYKTFLRKMRSNNKESYLKWNSVNDMRTCSRCAELDGKIFTYADLPEYVHVNCRCFVEPVD